MHTRQLTPTERKQRKITIFSFLIATLLGVLFHFLYELTGKQRIAGFFFPVNESTWEHLKLVFYPIALVSVGEYFFAPHKTPHFFCIKIHSMFLGMLAVIVFFYTYSGILGTTVDWFNIVIYVIAMAISYWYSYQKIKNPLHAPCNFTFSIASFTVMAILFMIFSLYPPQIGLFAIP